MTLCAACQAGRREADSVRGGTEQRLISRLETDTRFTSSAAGLGMRSAVLEGEWQRSLHIDVLSNADSASEGSSLTDAAELWLVAMPHRAGVLSIDVTEQRLRLRLSHIDIPVHSGTQLRCGLILHFGDAGTSTIEANIGYAQGGGAATMQKRRSSASALPKTAPPGDASGIAGLVASGFILDSRVTPIRVWSWNGSENDAYILAQLQSSAGRSGFTMEPRPAPNHLWQWPLPVVAVSVCFMPDQL